MKITNEPLENRQLRLTIEVDDERTQQAMQRAARQIAKQASIPGFRKGKAPYELIVQRFGEDTVRQEAAESLAEEVYGEAIKQEEIKPFDVATLEEIELHPITFTFTVPLHPIVDLGDYRSYRHKPPKVKVHRKEVQQALEGFREQNAVLEPVERPAALGDSVVIDLVGRTADGAERIAADKTQIVLEAGDPNLLPGLAEAIVGMEVGKEHTFALTMPDDHSQKELQGQEITFNVDLLEVYDRTLPKLDDDLARTVGNFDSLKELKQQVREQLQEMAQQEADKEYGEQVLETIVEQAQVEYPPVMLEEMVDDTVEDFERTVRREARLSLEDYLRFQGKSEDELRKEMEPAAAARLKGALVLGEIVRLEKLDVDEEDVDAQIEEISTAWGIRADEVRTSLSSDKGQEAVRNRLLGNKAVQRLVAIAKGEAPEVAPEEETEEKA